MQEIEFQIGEIRPIECFREAWAAIKPNFWLLFAITLVGFMIGGLSFYILLGPMVCGVFYCYFRVLDGEKVEFGDLFKGFNYFWSSLLVVIVMMAPVVILVAAIYVPLIIASFSGAGLSEDELLSLFSGILVAELISAIVMVCIHTLMMFSFPLIVDRGLSGWGSIWVSAKAVWKNLKGVTGLWAVSFVVTLVGYLGFCIGLYFVIPLIIAANVAAYRKVFPRTGGDFDGPPPPEAFLGATS